tara:strand:+ start:878 stop:2311 length:1434 start_codon:yes stop_codon:yes gene_type:complete
MKLDKKNLKDIEKNSLFKEIGSIADKLKIEAYIVGGYPRDLLLNNQNKQDIDFVVSDKVNDLSQILSKKLNTKVTIFKNFGTTHMMHENIELNFVEARKESYKDNSRNPDIKKATIKEDIDRRDFTINAISISLNKDNFGEILDIYNGQNDIKNQIIKTPLDPDKTFSDDPLRMLRAIRFANQLNFQIDAKTIASVKSNKNRIQIISQERITTEFNKILMCKNPSTGLNLLDQTGLLNIIFPELILLKGIDTKNNISHKDNFIHTLKVVDNINDIVNENNKNLLWLKWAALLHDIAKPKTKKFIENIGWTFYGHDVIGSRMIKKIFQKFKLPLNEKMKYVEKLVLLHLRPIALAKVEITDSAIRRLLFDAQDILEDLLILCTADITSKNEQKIKKYKQNYELVKKKLKEVEEKDKIRNWKPPINGNNIMKLLKLPQSKEIGYILNEIKEAILDGKIKNNKKEALELMYQKYEELKKS